MDHTMLTPKIATLITEGFIYPRDSTKSATLPVLGESRSTSCSGAKTNQRKALLAYKSYVEERREDQKLEAMSVPEVPSFYTQYWLNSMAMFLAISDTNQDLQSFE